MPLKLFVTAGIEWILNAFLYRSPALRTARQRLTNKILRICLKEFSTPLVVIFSEYQLDVLGQWEGNIDCSISTYMNVLPKLRDLQFVTALIRSHELEVEGDLQVLKNFVVLVDLAEFDPAELLALYIGDIAAESVSKVFRDKSAFLRKGVRRHKGYIVDVITEEWRMVPRLLEVSWFSEEITSVNRTVEAFSKRLQKLEGK